MDYSAFSNCKPLVFIIGINVIEDENFALDISAQLNELCSKLNVPFVFKASFDKANRSSISSFRGVGFDKGLKTFEKIKNTVGCSVLTDIHEPYQSSQMAEYVDILQLPAFLARQTDLVISLARTGKIVNIKKPQFTSPQQMNFVIEKFEEAGNKNYLLCERGSQFGYDNLVVDFLGFRIMKCLRSTEVPVIFDVTHSLQIRNGNSPSSGGRRSQFMDLALAGVSQGIAGLFIEVHPNPDKALCDGPSAIPISKLEDVLLNLIEFDYHVKRLNKISF